MLPLKQSLLCGLGLVSLVHQATSQNWDGPSPWPEGIAPDTIAADGWNSSYPAFEGLEKSYPALLGGTDGGKAGADTTSLEKRAAKDFYLRIMPLGASIVQGVSSSDEAGFRKLLRQQLR